ncbi:hypothetical protein EVAR_71641_1 [Eumeta japonica]|uniref:Uncharacterized protein n=1 Tax=Eumeta variegata TaxID=151549 RepID=A0A4C1T4L2_EUMVA|nr:hypothetical protein EVAR_71641_1 [Eumeta japonica]
MCWWDCKSVSGAVAYQQTVLRGYRGWMQAKQCLLVSFRLVPATRYQLQRRQVHQTNHEQYGQVVEDSSQQKSNTDVLQPTSTKEM